MQNEEKSKLEERIIQYFDGSLNGEESKSLLSDVGKSAEARALFKSHESLQRLITAARVPMEMPLEAKRSIAERIPGLIAFIPGLLGTAEAIPVITQSANPFIAFLSKIPLSTAISVGTSVAVLTTAGVIVKNKLDDNAGSNHKARIAAVQNNVTQPNAPLYAELPKRDVVVPQVGHGTAAYAAPATDKVNRLSNNLASRATNRTDGTNVITKSEDIAAKSSSVNSVNTSSTNTPTPKADNVASDIPAKTPIEKPASEAPATPSIELTASPRPVPGVNADIPNSQYGILAPMPEMFGNELPIRPFFAYGGRVNFSNVSNSVALNGGVTEDIRAGLDIPVSNLLAIRIQGGNSQFAHETVFGIPNGNYAGLPVYNEFTNVSLDAAYWATAGVAYQFYATDAIPLTLSAGFGAAFLQTVAPLVDLGVATEIPLSSNFDVRPGLSLQTAWTSQSSGTVNAVPSSAIIQNNEYSQSKMFSTSLGINIGFIFRF